MNHNDLMSFCKNIYSDEQYLRRVYKESLLDIFKDDSGLFLIRLKKGNQEIIVIRGTHLTDRQDVASDITMWRKKLPKQYYRAEQYILKLDIKKSNIIFTGHSLGGSIAQCLGTKYGNETVTFSAYGTAEFCQKKYENNITNYGMETDGIFMSKIWAQIGKTYIIPVSNTPDKFIINNKINYHLLKQKWTRISNGWQNHSLQDYNSLSSGILFDKNKLFQVHEILEYYINKCYKD